MKERVIIWSPVFLGSSGLMALCCTILFFTSINFSISAQGITLAKKGETRAIIVGISQYKNEEIEDLKFADRDARAFYNYIISPAGGSAAPENIKLLTNEEATFAKINQVMYWLMENSKEGDRAIIYFSGHGDVETITKRKEGYLLAYDSPAKVYGAGAYSLYFLRLALETLAESNTETIVITDACRSGKLAGNEFGGTQATALALQQQFANEIKIMSCQPNEFSLEGTQWGGGRSVFSYFLVQGLTGMADKDQDGVVTLMEIGRYLEDEVPRSVAPNKQIPLVEGDRNSRVAMVDDETLQNLLEEINPALATQSDPVNKTGNKWGENLDPGELSKEAQALLDSFTTAIKNKDLIGKRASAYETYNKIAANEELSEYKTKLSRQLSTALQEEVQIAINLYLESDNRELNDRWKFSDKYAKYPMYLEKAAELLPADHYSLSWLKCNQLYFEGVLLRLDSKSNQVDKSKLLKARSLQLQALSYDEYAAHVYNELGLIYENLGDARKEIESYQKALELSPNWAMPNSNLAAAYQESGELKKAIPFAEKAIKEKPSQPAFYYNLSIIYQKLGNYAIALENISKATQLDNNNVRYQFQLNEILLQDGQIELSKKILKKIEALCKEEANCLNNLAIEYYSLGNYEAYLRLLKRAISFIEPEDRRYKIFKNNFIYYYQATKDYDTFESFCLELIDVGNASGNTVKELASYYAMRANNQKAIEYLQKAFELGYSDVASILEDPNFSILKENEAFNELIDKYKN